MLLFQMYSICRILPTETGPLKKTLILVAEIGDWRAVRDRYRAYCRLWRSAGCIGKLILSLSIARATSYGEESTPLYLHLYIVFETVNMSLLRWCVLLKCRASIGRPRKSLTECMPQVPDEAGAAPFADPEHYHRCQSNGRFLKRLVEALTLHVPGLVCYWRCHGSARRRASGA